MKTNFRRGFVAAALAGATILAGLSTTASAGNALWLSAGQDRDNNRHQTSERMIGPESVAGLQVKWQFASGGAVSATPAVDGGKVYFPDFAGNLYALERETGAVVWHKTLVGYGPSGSPANNFARATPALAGGLLIVGDQGGRAALEGGQIFTTGSARVYALNNDTGDLVRVTQVDSHPPRS